MIYMSGARIFALANAGVVGTEMAEIFLLNEAKIVHAARRVTEPFVFAVGRDGLRRTRVRYPIEGMDF
ncbi:hypothetical protein [Thermoactinospora rubra]|uniref:hypothetical protein n=1 Tax=Thermoactinospora rubra TaxID=1088767 RepID=UPI000A0FEF84|nr:hypothetical protein [Thermoactinospora rubra]